jgi:putative acetyltransferase
VCCEGPPGAEVEIRPATEDDQRAIRAVHDAAFEGTLEGDIAAALRASGEDRISLVATEGEAIVGHVVLSEGRVGDTPVLCLGPIGVLPEHQGRGTGSALMRAALARAAESSAGLVVLVGHPGYYPRFGFEPARALGLECKWDLDEPWMALRLPRYDPALRGLVRYPPAFG